MRIVVILNIFLLTFTLFANSKMIKKVKKYQAVAEKALNELDTDTAKKNVLKAISVIESYRLTNKGFAKIYIVAAVLNTMIEDGNDAEGYIKKALKLDKDVKIPENFSSDELEAMYKKAKKELESGSDSFVLDSLDYKINFTPQKSHSVDTPLSLSLMVDPLPPEGYEVLLFFSIMNREYESLKLTKMDKKYVGEVAKEKLEGKDIKIYIMVVDPDLNPVAISGSREKPFNINLVNKLVSVKKDRDVDLDGDNKDKKKDKAKNDKKDLKSIAAINIETGTGVGLPSGDTIILNHPVDTGFALSPAWVGGDISFFISNSIMLGVGTRVQIIETAWLVALKLKLLLINSSSIKLISDFGFVYGNIRYQIDVSNINADQGTDVVENGFLGVNLGGTFVKMFTDNIGISGGVKSYILAPDFSIAFDLSIGLYFEF